MLEHKDIACGSRDGTANNDDVPLSVAQRTDSSSSTSAPANAWAKHVAGITADRSSIPTRAQDDVTTKPGTVMGGGVNDSPTSTDDLVARIPSLGYSSHLRTLHHITYPSLQQDSARSPSETFRSSADSSRNPPQPQLHSVEKTVIDKYYEVEGDHKKEAVDLVQAGNTELSPDSAGEDKSRSCESWHDDHLHHASAH